MAESSNELGSLIVWNAQGMLNERVQVFNAGQSCNGLGTRCPNGPILVRHKSLQL